MLNVRTLYSEQRNRGRFRESLENEEELCLTLSIMKNVLFDNLNQ